MENITLTVVHANRRIKISFLLCILPFCLQINLAASSAVKALERPELLQASLNDQLYKIKSSLPKPEFNYLIPKGNLSRAASSSSSCEQIEISNS